MRHLSTIAVVGAAVLWLVLLGPRQLGGPGTYVVVSGTSMLPSIHGGDLVVARSRGSYRIGEVVVYRIPAGELGAGRLVIHRIIGGSAARGYLLQGDNRAFHDPWRPRVNDIEGRTLAVAPRIGFALFYLRSPLALAALAGLLTFLLFTRPPRPATA
jgi:signal peptidase I